MASLNVNRNVCDVFYRYKMPRLLAKVEGKGNGVKTVIANMCDVAKALGRPPTYPTKYFGCELGAQVQCDPKNERFVVNGSHDANKLQTLLDGFIKRYVLCPACDNPETVLEVHQKKGTIGQSCKACGYHGNIDMRHRLSAFILKNPPDVKTSSVAAPSNHPKGKGKKGRKHQPEAGASAGSKHSSRDGEEDSGDSGANFAFAANARDDDDDDWAVDVSDEAVRARLNDLTSGAQSLVDTIDLTEKQRIDEFYKVVKEKQDADLIVTDSGLKPGVEKDIFTLAERLGVKEKATLILAEILLSNLVVKDLKNYSKLLWRFCNNCPKAQKYLLTGVENLVALNRNHLLPRLPALLKSLYDMDIVEEETFFDWEKKSSKNVSQKISEAVRERASGFLNWLRDASEEESSAEEDGNESGNGSGTGSPNDSAQDDLEITYDDRACAPKLETCAVEEKLRSESFPKDDEEELDIDAI